MLIAIIWWVIFFLANPILQQIIHETSPICYPSNEAAHSASQNVLAKPSNLWGLTQNKNCHEPAEHKRPKAESFLRQVHLEPAGTTSHWRCWSSNSRSTDLSAWLDWIKRPGNPRHKPQPFGKIFFAQDAIEVYTTNRGVWYLSSEDGFQGF